jgi:phytoene dehydrogenase-like protein
MCGMVDAVVIGSGPNGLVAANLLADAGWSVLVLEEQPTLGGAVHSDSELGEGFVSDTFSAFYPLGAGSPIIAGLHLEEHGLRWRRAPAVLGNPLPGGRWAVLHDDPADTAAGLDSMHPGDGDAWLELYATWEKFGGALIGALMSPFPPVEHGLQALATIPRAGGLALLRLLTLSVRRMGEERFGGEAGRLLLAGNAMHADFSPEGAGSGLFGWLLAMLGQQVGFPVPEGGAGALTQAMAARLRSLGGEVRCGERVDRVVVRNGAAVAVRTASCEEIPAERGVLADVVAPNLYGGLVAWDDLPARTRQRMQRFQWDPSTVKVDWALSAPIPWDPAPPTLPGCVHIADSVDELTMWNAQLTTGLVPASPFLLTGQMTTCDPTRSPAGTESAWAYTHVPRQVRGDAGDAGLTGAWDGAEVERFADRMQARIEHYAPGFTQRIAARRILPPAELQRRDANLVGGAINGGTAAIHQQLFFRPVAGFGRAETPVRRLFLASASAHPGGGVHGGPGSNAARAALTHDRSARALAVVASPRRLLRRSPS